MTKMTTITEKIKILEEHIKYNTKIAADLREMQKTSMKTENPPYFEGVAAGLKQAIDLLKED